MSYYIKYIFCIVSLSDSILYTLLILTDPPNGGFNNIIDTRLTAGEIDKSIEALLI